MSRRERFTQSRSLRARRTPGRRARRTDSRNGEGIEFEHIMVQITFAFVIILGYLVSMGIGEVNKLSADTRRYQWIAETANGAARKFGQTDTGQAYVGRVQAEKDTQLEKLLRVWEERKQRRELFKLLGRFDEARRVPLCDDLKCLPVGDDFEQLKQETRRVFQEPGQPVSRAEIDDLTVDVLKYAGFDVDKIKSSINPDLLPPDVKVLHFEKNLPTPSNVRALRLHIADDLTSERNQVVNLQFGLVGEIAKARIKRLLLLEVQGKSDVQKEGTNLGGSKLEQILADLRVDMGLLREVPERVYSDQSDRQDDSTGGATESQAKGV